MGKCDERSFEAGKLAHTVAVDQLKNIKDNA